VGLGQGVSLTGQGRTMATQYPRGLKWLEKWALQSASNKGFQEMKEMRTTSLGAAFLKCDSIS